ncbi:MAG TPA: hypothetical protein DEP05_09270 [Betaproteobacteria bacterium]|nr:hypothetical protein [Betaproteobacteria bacterium]
MQIMMNRGKGARSTAERRKLMRRHMGMMSEQRRTMQGTMGSGGANYGKTGRSSGLKIMRERMDMMQKTMRQMLGSSR